MQKFNIYVAEKSYNDYSLEKEIIEEAGGKILFSRCRGEDDIIAQCSDAHAILLRQTPMGDRAFKELIELRVVSRYGVGYDNIDVPAATRYGVLVTIVPDYCIGEVADHTIALLLALVRKITLRDRFVRLGSWDLGDDYPVYRTNGRILGLVGYGRTAREVRKRLSGFPFRFVAYDPLVATHVFAADDTEKVDFPTLIRISDYVSVHTPLNEHTYHLFNLQTFCTMKRSAILVNTSRGPVVDTKALYTALKDSHIAGAALDVYETEPFDILHPLSTLNNIILSDHAAWYSEDSQKELQIRTAQEAVRVLTGRLPENPVNPQVLRSTQWRIYSKESQNGKILSEIPGKKVTQLEKVL
jgi:D-3-phosphoglycerate dehydrogenase